MTLWFMVLIVVWFFSESQSSKEEIGFLQNSLVDISLSEINNWIVSTHFSQKESLYSSNKTITKKWTDSLEVDVSEPWLYLSSFRDLNSQHSFKASWFEIIQKWIGEVYIDTQTQTGSVMIFALNTPVQLTLKSSETTQKYTDIYLLPHMYIIFEPSRWKFLESADFVRVQTVYQLWYLSESLSNILQKDNIGVYKNNFEKFVLPLMTDIYARDTIQKNNLMEIQSQNISNIPAYDMIQQYSSLFFNKEKKIVYYKNLILQNYLDISRMKEIDDGLITETRDNLQSLKSLSSDSYIEMIEFKEIFESLLVSSVSAWDSISRVWFALLDNKNSNMNSFLFSSYGYSLYWNLDKNQKYNEDIAKKYIQSFPVFNSYISKTTQQSELLYQYFSLFLEKQLTSFLDDEKVSQNTTIIIETLSRYIENSNLAFSRSNILKITSLYVYSSILEKLDTYMRSAYFQPERSDENILVPKSGQILWFKDLTQLKKQIEIISSFYKKTSYLLEPSNTRDNAISINIQNSLTDISEYFIALENYELYIAEYDVSKQWLFNPDSNSQDEELTEEKGWDFISQFNDVVLSNTSLKVINNNYYEFKNVVIQGKRFDFDLYPNAWNKIQNISLDSKKLGFVYRLDPIQKEWEEKFKSASEEEKDIYNFSNFFQITFLQKTESWVQEFEDKKVILDEDASEVVFKRDILVASEFKPIKKFIDIQYNDITLEKNSWRYDTYINDVEVLVPQNANVQSEYISLFSMQYMYGENEKYFKNIKVKIKKSLNWVRVDTFGWEQISFAWTISKNEFISFYENFFLSLIDYSDVYDTVSSKYKWVQIDVSYNSITKKLSLKFDSAWKKYTILLEQEWVYKIFEGTRNILDAPVPHSDIRTYLP